MIRGGTFLLGIAGLCVQANVEHMQKIMDQLTKNETEVSLASSDSMPQIRLKTSMMAQLIEIMDLDRYGCWCYFGKDHGKGHGAPVDEFDKYCQHLHQGYDCAIIDSAKEGEVCVAWETDYSIENIYTRMNIYAECEQQNRGNKCAINACTVELNFIFILFEKYFMNSYPAIDYRHNLGFDPKMECHGKESKVRALEDRFEQQQSSLRGAGVGGYKKESTPGIVKPKELMECCGNYPYRHPYKPEDGERGCCGSKTYTTSLLTCCAPDVLRAVCE